MVKSNSIQENTREERVESIIINALLKGESIIIPDFGHLEVKSLGEKHTIFVKVINTNDNSLSQAQMEGKEGVDDIYQIISNPLKEGRTVNLTRIGIFRPVKRENGEIYISFIPSAQLRMMLSGEGEKRNEVLKTSNVSENKNDDQSTTPDNVDSKDIGFKYVKESSFPQNSNLKKDETIVPQNDNRREKRWKNISGILLPIVALIALVVVIGTNIHTRQAKVQTKVFERQDLKIKIPSKVEALDLPALAEQHYGNSAFWVYIYRANKDKLDSPINIPKDVSLVFPDLKTEFDVKNITDSTEIRRAKIIADIILKDNSIATKNSNR